MSITYATATDFVAFMLSEGVDAFDGQAASTVSSERFDYLTNAFLTDSSNRQEVLRLLRAFALRRRQPHSVRGRLQRLGNRLREAVEDVSDQLDLGTAPATAYAEVFPR